MRVISCAAAFLAAQSEWLPVFLRARSYGNFGSELVKICPGFADGNTLSRNGTKTQHTQLMDGGDGGMGLVAADTPPPTLATLPDDVLVTILAVCDLTTLGRVSGTCETLSHSAVDGAWRHACLQQGLVSKDPKVALRRAAECNHHIDSLPSSSFSWVGAADSTSSLTCSCNHCHRQYTVVLAMGFIDTPTFASKLVTRASFRSLCPAPRHHREFEATWDRRDASAARQAEQEHEQGPLGAPTSAEHAKVPAAGSRSSGAGWQAAPLAFFGTQRTDGRAVSVV